jgi:hypothetical protein
MRGSSKVTGNTGRGVVFYGDFTMSGNATVSGNTGRGVTVYDGDFTMSGSAAIRDNTADNGDGVYVGSGGTFTMSGSGSATATGGGVHVRGDFIMRDNTVVSDNTADDSGGGVYVSHDSSVFTKTGGVIYGDTDGTHTPGSDENTVTAGNTNGHAVLYWHYYDSSYRDATLNTGDDISTEDTLSAASGETLNGWTRK